MKIGQAILTDENKTLSGNFTKIGIQTPIGIGDVKLQINDTEITVTPLTNIYELEGVNITKISLETNLGYKDEEQTNPYRVIVDYIEGVNANG